MLCNFVQHFSHAFYVLLCSYFPADTIPSVCVCVLETAAIYTHISCCLYSNLCTTFVPFEPWNLSHGSISSPICVSFSLFFCFNEKYEGSLSNFALKFFVVASIQYYIISTQLFICRIAVLMVYCSKFDELFLSRKLNIVLGILVDVTAVATLANDIC